MYFPAILFVLFYTLAMVALWCVPPRGRMSVLPWLLFSLVLLVALVEGWLQPLALVWVALLMILARGFMHFDQGWQHYLSLAGLVVMVLALATHQLPGFLPVSLDAEQRYRNLDKACVAFVLLAILTTRITSWRELYRAFSSSWVLFVVAPLVIFPLAYQFGVIEAISYPTHALWLWAWGNLLVTCVAEELFFRALIQRYLSQLWRSSYWGWLAALLLSSLLFGLVHIGGGLVFSLLAVLAGLFYGWAYHLSGRIEIAILLHFYINTVHLLLRS